MSKSLLLAGLVALSATSAHAGMSKLSYDHSKVKPIEVVVPEREQDLLLDADIEKLSENFKTEMKRRPSSSKSVASADLISAQYKKFVKELTEVKNGDEYYALLKRYDDAYNTIPDSASDLKFTIAKLSTWLPMRGIVWRMAPLVHQVLPTQQMLLLNLSNYAEQVKINFDETHAEAQFQFLTIPAKDILGTQFKTESEYVAYLGTTIHQSLMKAITRLEKIKMFNKSGSSESPIVFDAKIRFGENAFGDEAEDYNNYDRYKIVGEAERFSTIARYYRRAYNIAFMNAYNWNGHLALRTEIARQYGLGVVESQMFASFNNTPYIKGVTREQRKNIIKKYTNLWKLQPNGKLWMRLAYTHLHRSTLYLSKTWDAIKNSDNQYLAQLDPEVFTARKEQIEGGILNIKKLTGPCNEDSKSGLCDLTTSGAATIYGNVEKKEGVTVNLKGFFNNPPSDLKNLLPVSFAKNEDIMALKKFPTYAGLKEISPGKSDLIEIDFSGNQKTVFRNYFFGRSTGWDISKNAYGILFPEAKKPEDVAHAVNILNFTRGTRVVANGIMMFLR